MTFSLGKIETNLPTVQGYPATRYPLLKPSCMNEKGMNTSRGFPFSLSVWGPKSSTLFYHRLSQMRPRSGDSATFFTKGAILPSILPHQKQSMPPPPQTADCVLFPLRKARSGRTFYTAIEEKFPQTWPPPLGGCVGWAAGCCCCCLAGPVAVRSISSPRGRREEKEEEEEEVSEENTKSDVVVVALRDEFGSLALVWFCLKPASLFM